MVDVLSKNMAFHYICVMGIIKSGRLQIMQNGRFLFYVTKFPFQHNLLEDEYLSAPT